MQFMNGTNNGSALTDVPSIFHNPVKDTNKFSGA
jgi:hypothetical protein